MKMNETFTEAVKSYKKGNEAAFSVIYEESYRYLYTCIWNVIKNEDLAQDMLQETYMEVVKNINQLRDETTFLSWAATIANRKCYAYIKKDQDMLADVAESKEGDESDFFENIADDEAFIPENIFDNQEKIQIIRKLIDELNDIQRACIIGVYYNEMKQEEVAKELGIPVNTVKSHLNRAKSKLKAAVGDTEKQQGIKLYSIAPFMLLFFTQQAKQWVVAPMSEPLKNAVIKHSAEMPSDGNGEVSRAKKAASGVGRLKLAGIVGSSVAVVGLIGAGIWGIQSQNQKTYSKAEAALTQESLLKDNDMQSVVTSDGEIVDESEGKTEKDSVEDKRNEDVNDEESTDQTEGVEREDTPEEAVELSADDYFVVPEKYEAFGNAYGGVLPVRENGLWGAIDYSGAEIVPCTYEKLCRSANDRGYFILGEGDLRILFDAQGNMVYSGEDLKFASGTMYVVCTSDGFGTEPLREQYYTYDGTLVLELEAADVDELAGSFVDGYATVYRNKATYSSEEDNNIIEEVGQLSLDGEVTWSTLYDGPDSWIEPGEASDMVNGIGASSHQCVAPASSLNKDYYLSVNWMQGQILQLRDRQNQLCSYKEYLDLWSIKAEGDTVSFDAMDYNEDKDLKSYFLDGGYLYNYGSLINFVEGEKYYLIDLNGTPRCLGAFDYLSMSEEKLWGIKKDDMWGYIDHQGNIKGLYEDASAFSNGVAFVVENGQTYLINDNLEKIGEFGPSDRVGRVGDAICLEIHGERRLFFTH